MAKLTKLQYEVIFLYSKGLTFKEIDTALKTASKGVYSQVIAKDKGRVIRAKKARETNLNSYKQELKIYIDDIKKNNRYFNNFFSNDRYTICTNLAKNSFRKKYINDSLDKAYKSYCKYKLTFLKNYLEKVA
jgi:hypothetical protein